MNTKLIVIGYIIGMPSAVWMGYEWGLDKGKELGYQRARAILRRRETFEANNAR